MMSDELNKTNRLDGVVAPSSSCNDRMDGALDCLSDVCHALCEKGYDPVNQVVGYIMSGDPVYITSHNAARNKILMFSREDLLISTINFFLKNY